MKFLNRIFTPVEDFFASCGRRWGYKRGARFFVYLRKYRARYYSGRSDAVTKIDDYDGDLQIYTDRSAYMGGLIYWHGGQTTPGFRLLVGLLKPGMVMLDVGANQGEATLLAAKRVKDGRVISFEPVSSLCSQLQKNVYLNHFQNVTIFNCALASQPGRMPLYTSMDEKLHDSWNEGLASLYQSDYRNTLLQMVPVERLDVVVKKIGLTRVDVIKIDVEGAELEVLKGATEILKDYRPNIVMEINPSALEVAGTSSVELVKFLNSFGYKTNIIYQDGKYNQISSQILDDCDVFCVPSR